MKKIISTTLLALFLSAGLVGCDPNTRNAKTLIETCDGELAATYTKGPFGDSFSITCRGGETFAKMVAN